MPQTFLVLLAAGILLAAAVSNPQQVTLLWLRLGGIIALAMLALSIPFFLHTPDRPPMVLAIYAFAATAILAHLALVQTDHRAAQRLVAPVAAAILLALAALFLPPATGAVVSAEIGIALMTGLVLMEMLLGHAYLTASKMTIHPFLRLNRVLAVVLVLRAIQSGGIALLLQARQPISQFWAMDGFLLATRWLVGLVVPAVFIYMAHDCIKRRSTQSATGILYVAAVVIFIGELIALALAHETGLPF